MSSRQLPFSVPDPAGSERAKIAKQIRDLATEVSRLQPQATTRANGEESEYGPIFPTNFTKGLLHDENGLLVHDYDSGGEPKIAHTDYPDFVEAINSPDRTLFEKHVFSAADHGVNFNCTVNGDIPNWRGWESPRSGHVYELQGADAGAVGMAPAPRVGSSELAFEMAEVYGLAILRDVPFSVIAEGGEKKVCTLDGRKTSILSANQVLKCLQALPYWSEKGACSSTPHQSKDGFNGFERKRRDSRGPLKKPNDLFRGSTKGSQVGPYISQFMLVGNGGLGGPGPNVQQNVSNFPGVESGYEPRDGFINYGTLIIDQRTVTAKACLDYMTDWASWLDVQNGSNMRDSEGTRADQYESDRRFIMTPRDLATYVHFDALYEAYLNACLIMLGMGVPASRGFPEPTPSGKRDAFATFSGPHILSLVTEVATRCLKAVRRQKFNYHRRCRPEAIGGRLTLAKLGLENHFGCAENAFVKTLKEMESACKGELLEAVIKHNYLQNSGDVLKCRSERIKCDAVFPVDKLNDKPKKPKDPKKFISQEKKFPDCNLLLPMAFPEGSPMHPAYGAGHATVAGGCVTMLKAFFEMYDDRNPTQERELDFAYEADPATNGTTLRSVALGQKLTIQGELDKLAANISVGRNMAGVHYYSDYYDSTRMGERIAVSILLEQAPTYGDYVETTFKSFDGDHITISGEAGSCPSLTVIDKNGHRVSAQDWWLRHVPGQEFSEDL